jgi:hypothetical protein
MSKNEILISEIQELQIDLSENEPINLPLNDEEKQLQTKESDQNIKEKEMRIKNLKEEYFSTCKTPMYIYEKDGEINWKESLIKEGAGSFSDVLKNLTGTKDYDLAASVFDKGRHALPDTNEIRAINTTLQDLANGEPKDITESRLITQQAALFAQGMQYLSRAETGSLISQKDFCLKNAIKLLRLHNETIEALGKYRKGNEQRIVVQHINVGGEAQAIVNNGNMVAEGVGKNKKNDEVIP